MKEYDFGVLPWRCFIATEHYPVKVDGESVSIYINLADTDPTVLKRVTKMKIQLNKAHDLMPLEFFE